MTCKNATSSILTLCCRRTSRISVYQFYLFIHSKFRTLLDAASTWNRIIDVVCNVTTVKDAPSMSFNLVIHANADRRRSTSDHKSPTSFPVHIRHLTVPLSRNKALPEMRNTPYSSRYPCDSEKMCKESTSHPTTSNLSKVYSPYLHSRKRRRIHLLTSKLHSSLPRIEPHSSLSEVDSTYSWMQQSLVIGEATQFSSAFISVPQEVSVGLLRQQPRAFSLLTAPCRLHLGSGLSHAMWIQCRLQPSSSSKNC